MISAGDLLELLIRRRDAKVPAGKRIITVLRHCARARQSPTQPILETDLAVPLGMTSPLEALK